MNVMPHIQQNTSLSISGANALNRIHPPDSDLNLNNNGDPSRRV